MPSLTTNYKAYRSSSFNSSANLLENNETPVVLLGDSFVKGRPEWGFSDVLSSYLQTEVINFGVPAGGMVASPALYFNSLDLNSPMPKFLIWQISVRDDSADGNILRQSIDALRPCVRLWGMKVTSRAVGAVKLNIPPVVNAGFFKISNYSLTENLTLTVDYVSGQQQTYTYNRFSSEYRLDGLDKFFLPIPLERKDDMVKKISASKSPNSSANIELCQRER